MRRVWLILLLLPLAQAAPDAREVDTRLLEDTTSSGDYGTDGVAEGLDLLSLDALEGVVPGTLDGAVVFRIAFQGGGDGTHHIDVMGKSSQAFTLSMTSDDLESWSSDDFDAVRGPFTDGDVHIVEGIASYQTLDASIGDDLTEIRVESVFDDEAQDKMPGTWYLAGETVPLPPGEEEDDPATLGLGGPLRTLNASADRSILPVGDATVLNVMLTSQLEDLAQAVTVTVLMPDNLSVEGPTEVSLDAAASETLTFTFSGVAEGDVKLLFESHVGTSIQVALPLEGAGSIGPGGNVESGDMEAGDSFQYTFTEPGFFDYHCHPHPWMVGGITIVDAGENVTARAPLTHVVKVVEPDPSDTDTWGFEPAEFDIAPGDTVVWVNEGAMVHDIRGSTGIGSDGHDHDHDHDHGDNGDKDTPAPLLILPLLAALLLRRR